MKIFAFFAGFTCALPAYTEVAELAAQPNATEAVKEIESRMEDVLQKQNELNQRQSEVSFLHFQCG